MRLGQCNGRSVSLHVPPPLDAAVRGFAPQMLLWTDYPETEGQRRSRFTPRRAMLARLLVRPERLAALDLAKTARQRDRL